ncbi:MAG: ABC transporter ATP-binding protein [Lachnospiraceae bacterium]|uniref:ABC-F family ATP-binding cassette domain-containing protein n=1 Tax=Candidatus Weimeria bifida TaxID=2599074 RepID=A0A6N7IY59_9FIRM|nr:ABC-F family ATP-binding cassette domain-containing protein [Candidatus Weimeria bifida]RRF95670.1 MAG: ABC transporter ATP-binding protein [Lachnospiraceae bacterium]
MILSVSNLTKRFGEKVVFEDLSFQIREHEHAAIVGNNGCGKSTLLKVIVGEEPADSGSVVFAKDSNYGYLAQYQDADYPGTIWDYVYHAREDIIEMDQNLHRMESDMKTVSGDDLTKLMDSYQKLSHQFMLADGESYVSRVGGTLKGLGFTEDDFQKTMTELSGGQKTRVALSKLLVTNPDLLLLDEPINHLDLRSIEWLENFLMNYNGAVVIVAHDRYFLDRTVTRCIDLSDLKAHDYKGNYTEFMRQKDLFLLSREREYEKQQKKIEHEEKVIEKLQSFNREKSIRRAESRKKVLEKIDRIEKPQEMDHSMKLSLQPISTSGNDVLTVEHLSKAFDGNQIFSDISFEVKRGEKVALIGDNGIGKSTILKIINNIFPADSGKIKIGTGVTIGYYDQEQHGFNEDNTLFDEMHDAYPTLNNTRIRNVLAAFLFREDEVFKQIRDLSGGERGRVSLAKLMLAGDNFLILDEPTNHLDMDSKEILEHALNNYEGTVLYVSHDRYFVNQTADRILELKSDGMHEYLGNYDYYLSKRDDIKTDFGLPDDTAEDRQEEKPQSSADDWKKQKEEARARQKKEREIKNIEEQIEDLETEKSGIESQFADPQIAKNSAKLNELTAQLKTLDDSLKKLYDKWERLLGGAE